MPICLLCGEDLIDKTYYETHKAEFRTVPKFKHKEHIIQNAIGGRLKSDEILCESCGNILNDEIDTEFLKLFTSFTQQLKETLVKERNKNASTPVKGQHLTSKREVIYLDKKVTPKKPDYTIDNTAKTVTIYANKVIIPQYRKFVLSELVKTGINPEDYKIEEVTEYEYNNNIALYFSEGVENFNEKWKLGFIKIATEFAYLKGVARNQLTRTIDTANNKIIYSDNVIPFFPLSVVDAYMEQSRMFLEDIYPTHTLILFTQEFEGGQNQLICYIDLFSTFQFYVLLSDNYTGDPMLETYCQKVEKEVKPEIDFRRIRLKHLHPLAKSLGLDFSNYKGESIEDLYNFIETEYARISIDYTVNLSDLLSNTLSNLLMAFTISQSEYKVDLDHLTEAIKSFENISNEAKLDFAVEMNSLLNPDETVRIDRYRQCFVEQDGQGGYETLPYTIELIKELNKSKKAVTSYCHMKFGHFSYYVGKQG